MQRGLTRLQILRVVSRLLHVFWAAEPSESQNSPAAADYERRERRPSSTQALSPIGEELALTFGDGVHVVALQMRRLAPDARELALLATACLLSSAPYTSR